LRPSRVIASPPQLVRKPNNVSALVQLRTQTFPRALLFWLRLGFDAAGCTNRWPDHESGEYTRQRIPLAALYSEEILNKDAGRKVWTS
jgi:hypothetical protein